MLNELFRDHGRLKAAARIRPATIADGLEKLAAHLEHRAWVQRRTEFQRKEPQP